MQLAAKWRTLDASVRVPALAVAVDEDAATFDRVLAALPAETDAELRSDAFSALMAVRDPARLRTVLALALDPELDRTQARVLMFAGRDAAQYRVVNGYVREHITELLARFPDNGIGGTMFLVPVLLRSCDASRRDDDAAFVRQHFGAMPGGEKQIARSLESLDQCIAGRALLGPKLEAWLAKTER